jgi:hypothetical protein
MSDIEVMERQAALALGARGAVKLPTAAPEVLDALRAEGVQISAETEGVKPKLHKATLPEGWHIAQVARDPRNRELRRADGTAVAAIFIKVTPYDSWASMSLIRPRV